MPPTIDDQDATIVLSSDDENDRSTTTGSRHSRRTTPLHSGQGNYSSSSQDTVTTNDIAWLTPAEHSNHSETPPHRSNSLIYRDGADLSPSTHLPNSVTDGNSRAQSTSRKSSEEVQILSDAPSSSNGVPPSSAAPRKPKSLFAPGCAKKLLPSEPVTVKGENKLLAALWQERRNRLAANGGALVDPALSTSAVNEEQKDGITSMNPGNEQADGSTTNGDNTCAQEAQPGSSAGSVARGNSVELVDAPSTSTNAGNNVGSMAVRSPKKSQGKRKKRRHDGKWESIFKRFRNKLQRETNPRKRERAYNFLIEMKQLEEDRRKRNSYRSPLRTTERRSRRTSSSSRDSSLSRRGDRSGDEVGVERA